MVEFNHKSVMLFECVDGLNIKKDGIYLDCTVGGAGHSFEIAKKLDKGTLLCLDKDEEALSFSKQKLKEFGEKVKFFHTDFKNFEEAKNFFKIDKFDGILVDLGVSSYQIDTPERGFSYMHDADLDMRMDKAQKQTAKEVINTFKKEELAKIFWEYGEEQFAQNIAKNIVIEREIKPIETTFELNKIIEKSIPAKIRFKGGHASKKVFQALRIFVNKELDGLYDTILKFSANLNKGGRLVLLTFHSLEDRIVKKALSTLSTGCICPPEVLICCCGHKPELKLVNKKPILASKKELEENSRSHSAKLRVAEKL